MSNPFKTNQGKNAEYTGEGFFTDHVKNEISHMAVGDSKQFNKSGADVAACRMTIRHVAGDNKFKTKVVDNQLWIKRVK